MISRLQGVREDGRGRTLDRIEALLKRFGPDFFCDLLRFHQPGGDMLPAVAAKRRDRCSCPGCNRAIRLAIEQGLINSFTVIMPANRTNFSHMILFLFANVALIVLVYACPGGFSLRSAVPYVGLPSGFHAGANRGAL